MMVALAGQQSALETKAFSKLIPLAFSSERVLGMYLRSSFRISSARIKTMLGLAVAPWPPERHCPKRPTRAAQLRPPKPTTVRSFSCQISSLAEAEEKVLGPRPVKCYACSIASLCAKGHPEKTRLWAQPDCEPLSG